MDQREAALVAGHLTTLTQKADGHQRSPSAVYNGLERRRPGRVTHDPHPGADREAKMRAWQNTLEKAAGVMRAHGHCGDAATLEDIARVLRDVKP